MFVRSLKGDAGEISVPGLGAVVGQFQSWNLMRREENGSAGPIWTLHAVFRYQNDLLLKNPLLGKRVTLVVDKKRTIKICDWESIDINGSQLIMEGVIQCPQS